MEDQEKLKEQTEDLKSLIQKAKQDIANIESLSSKANRLIAVIEDYNSNFEQIRAKLDDPNTGIISNLERSKNTKSEIDTLKSSSDEQLSQIKTALASVQGNIQQMNVAYEEFKTLNSKILNPDTGLNGVLQKATQVKLEIDTLRNSSDDQLTQIKTALATVQQNIQQMNVAYEEFQVIKNKIEDPKSGIASIFEGSEDTRQEIVAVKKQSDIVFQEIKKFREESQNYTKEIENFKKVSEVNKNTILNHEKESSELKEKIKKIYQIATDSALANSFDERKKELDKSRGKWLIAIIASTSLLLIILLAIFLPSILDKSITIDGYLWFRITLTSPLIFFIVFATVEYSKERNYLEKYAFKSATALSLEGYTTLLINTFGKNSEKKNEDKILDFVINSMTMIYQEPYDPVKESKISLGFGAKFANMKADITKTMKETGKEIVESVKGTVSKDE